MSLDFYPLPLQAQEILTKQDLGRGYKVNGRGDTQAVFVELTDPNYATEMASKGESHFQLVTSANSMLQALNVQAEASLKFKIFSGSMAGGFMQSNSSSASELVLFYYKHMATKTIDIDENSKPPVNPQLMASQQPQILETWGGHYLSTLVYGASLQVTARIKSSDEQHLMDIKANLSGSIDLTAFSLTVAAEGEWNETHQDSQTEFAYDIYQRGGKKSVQDMNPTTWDGVMQLIDQFAPEEDGSSVAPVGYRIKPIPIDRVPQLNLTEAQLMTLQNNTRTATSYLVELFRMQGVTTGQKTLLNSSDQSPFFRSHLQKQFVRECDSILDDSNPPVATINNYLAQNPMDVIMNVFSGWSASQQSELQDRVDAVSELGTIPFTLSGSDGTYTGYLLKDAPNYLGYFVADRPSDPTDFVGFWYNSQRSQDNGKMTWKNKDTYVGGWYQDKMDGDNGYFVSNDPVPNNYTFLGRYEDGLRQGYGVLTWLNKTVFKGTFVDDHMSNGEMDYNTGDVYTGDFKDSKRDGQGTMVWIDGTTYVGAWADDTENGYGTMTFPNHTSETGYWKDGVYQGQNPPSFAKEVSVSKVTSPHAKPKKRTHGKVHLSVFGGGEYNGEFYEGIPDGHGEFVAKDHHIKYVGSFIHGKLHGDGRATWANGDVYHGQWYNNSRNGRGELTYANGDHYVGNWVNDHRQGAGTITYKHSGEKYEGMWRQDKKYGHGVLTHHGGARRVQGTWRNDQFFAAF